MGYVYTNPTASREAVLLWGLWQQSPSKFREAGLIHPQNP